MYVFRLTGWLEFTPIISLNTLKMQLLCYRNTIQKYYGILKYSVSIGHSRESVVGEKIRTVPKSALLRTEGDEDAQQKRKFIL